MAGERTKNSVPIGPTYQHLGLARSWPASGGTIPLHGSQFLLSVLALLLGDAFIIGAKQRGGGALGQLRIFGRHPAASRCSPAS
jgi:hypothetical protein